jgi:phage terminase small subunit
MNNLRKMYERAAREVEVLDKNGEPVGEFVFQGQVANRALELIGKQLGMFQEKIEVGGSKEPITHMVITRTIREGEAGDSFAGDVVDAEPAEDALPSPNGKESM